MLHHAALHFLGVEVLALHLDPGEVEALDFATEELHRDDPAIPHRGRGTVDSGNLIADGLEAEHRPCGWAWP